MISVATTAYIITGITITATSLSAKQMEERCMDVIQKGGKNNNDDYKCDSISWSNGYYDIVMEYTDRI